MVTATNLNRVVKVEHEDNSEVVWIDRESLDGKVRSNCAPVAPWGDADAMVRAAKVMFRLAWN